MPRSKVQVAILISALMLAMGGTWTLYRTLAKDNPSTDATAQFLARHWARPLAPQGDPPPEFSSLEASLAPESCGACHPEQYADWGTSLHSHSIGPGILWQFRVLSQDESNGCLRCHAPLAEQKALMALQQGWTNAPKTPVPAYVSNDLHLRGLVCAACHVRRHQRYGPPVDGLVETNAQDPAQAIQQPHDGFIAVQAFQDSLFCATCHQFPPQGRSLAGKLVENTYEEWRTSPAAKQGLACQNCHMPGKRHLWRGIHDRAMVDKGLRRELFVKRISATRLAVQAIVTAPGVGHYFPTYVVPKVTISLQLRNSEGTREIAHHVIGRTVSVDMDHEFSDTRIPPGGKSMVSVEISVPPGSSYIEMRMDIAPAEHYERMFESMLKSNPKMDPTTQSLLREALQQAKGTAYQLDDLVVSVPDRMGMSQHSVAN